MADESVRRPDPIEDPEDEHISQIPDSAVVAPAIPTAGLDGAIRTAFADGLDHGAPSVLLRIDGRGAQLPRVHLTSPDAEPGPMLRPAADDGSERDRYRVLGEVARGGVGTILQVRDTDLGRDVAVKVLHDRYAKNPDVIQRFVEEAQIGGQLQHPGVVPVYELGVQKDGRPFFAMKLVKGLTLSSILSRRSSPRQDRAELLQIFQKVCQTMAYAHARKVIHRDLKPSNVMVGAFGEVQVVDWGFAKVLGQGGVVDERTSRREPLDLSVIETVRSGSSGSGSASVAGAVLGTPAYMSPEQALGDIERLDERADVFALGAILCEILTGRPPYERGAANLVVQAARAELEDVFGELDRCGADPRVIHVAKACLSPARRKRPRDAAQVERQITRYLHSREEQARKAELKASAAEARVAAERRARKRILWWAGTAVAALLLGVVGLLAARTASIERTRQTARLVEEELKEADGLARLARAQDGAARTAWRAAVERAGNAVAVAEREEADEITLERARGRLAALEQDSTAAARRAERRSADHALREELREYAVRARLPETYDLSAEGDRLVLALAEWGLRLRKDTPTRVVAKLADTTLRSQIIQAVDLHRLGLEDEGRAPVDAILAAVDPDPWRSKVRAVGLDRSALLTRADAWGSAKRDAADAILLSGALARAEAVKEAAAVLQDARDRHPGHPLLATSLACVASRGEAPDWPTVGAALEVARRTGELPFGLKRLEVRALLDAGAVERGLGLARALHAVDTEDETATELLATALAAQAVALRAEDKRDAAAAAWREAATLTPDADERRAQLVWALLRAEDFEEAHTVAKEHVRRSPEDWERQALLAHVLQNLVNREGKSGFAERLVEAGRAAVAACPEEVRLRQEARLANYLNLAGRADEAEALARRLLTEAEEAALRIRAHQTLGAALSAQGRYNDAAACFESAVALDGAEIDDRYAEVAVLNAHIHHARVLRLMGEQAAAVAHLDASMEELPESAHNYRLAAAEYLNLGEAAKGLAQIERALALEPDDAAAHALKANALIGQGRLDEALDQLDVAARAGAQGTGYLRLFVLTRLGRVDAAIDAIGRTRLAPSQLQTLAAESGQRQLDRLTHRLLSRRFMRQRTDWRVRLQLGGLLARSQDPRVADAELALEIVEEVPEAALRGYGWHTDLRNCECDALLRLGRVAEARAKKEDSYRWLQVLGITQRNAGLAALMHLQGRFQEARELLEEGLRAVDGAGDDVRAHPMGAERRASMRVTLGPILLAQGRYAEARARLDEALEIARSSSSRTAPAERQKAHLVLARLALCRGDWSSALQQAEAARREGEQSGAGATSRDAGVATALARLGQADLERAHAAASRAIEEIEALGKARDLWSEAEARLVLGTVLLEQKRHEEARALLTAAEEAGWSLDHAPTTVAAACRLATVPGGDAEAAAETLAELEDRLPLHDRIAAHHLLFEASGDRAHKAAARKLLDQLVKIQDPSEREALRRNVPIYTRIGGAR